MASSNDRFRAPKRYPDAAFKPGDSITAASGLSGGVSRFPSAYFRKRDDQLFDVVFAYHATQYAQ